MLDEEEKNAAPSDKKKSMWVGSQVFQKQKIGRIWEVLRVIKAISRKHQKKSNVHWSAVKVRDKCKQVFNCPSGIKECNVGLIYNIQFFFPDSVTVFLIWHAI